MDFIIYISGWIISCILTSIAYKMFGCDISDAGVGVAILMLIWPVAVPIMAMGLAINALSAFFPSR